MPFVRLIANLKGVENKYQCKIMLCNVLTQYKMADMISRVRVMQLQEKTTYITLDYLNQNNVTVTAEERRDLCQWGFDILDRLEVNRYIAVVAIGYFDRFLSHSGSIVVEICLRDLREFQLAFVVSCWSLFSHRK